MKPRVMGQFYEREFEDFKKNQRDLSNSKRESSMKKLSGEHLKTIDRVTTILRIHLMKQKVPKYARELERDIEHLTELCEYIEDTVDNPTFSALEDTARKLAL